MLRVVLAAFFILFAMLAWDQTASANGAYCGRTYYAAPTYYAQPTYYAAPTYVEKVVVKEVAVPYAKPVFLNRDYYFSVGEYYRDQQRDDVIASAAAYKALLLQAQMLQAGNVPPAASYQGYGGYSATPGARLVPAQPSAAPQQPPGPPQGVRPPTGPLEAPGAGGPVSPKLKTIVEDKCVVCHQGQPKRLDLRNLDQLTEGQWALCYAKVNANKMPKAMKGKPVEPLKDDEVSEFLNRVEQYSPATD